MDFYKKIITLLQWENPLLTGLAFYSLNVIFYLIIWKDHRLISILSSLGIVFLSIFYCYQMTQDKQEEEQPIEFVSYKALEEMMNSAYHASANFWNNLVRKEGFFYRIGFLTLIYYVSGMMTTASFLWIVMVLSFSLPLVYKRNQEQINFYISSVVSTIESTLSKMEEKIPRAKGVKKLS